MDHLPTVVNSYDPIAIPYLGGNEYNGLDFGGYPERQNWQISALLDGDLQGRTHVEAAQYLQTWLYFGMLHEALRLFEDNHIQLSIFIRIDDQSHQKFITMHQLPRLLQTWHQRVKQMQNVKIYYERLRNCIKIACVDGETFFIRWSLLNGTLPWEDLHLHTRKNLAVIILAIKGLAKKQSSGAVVEGSMKNDASGIETALGALVERQERAHENERCVSYLRFVSVVKKGSFADKHPNVPWSSKEIEEKERTPVAGTYLPDGQSWRVN
ncbi:hypothetical protein LTR66_013862 [Elasticomyces elasticus]|nr:hypothetical protein LTR66_013862 [Elasticomyces elasticus]